MLTIGFFALTQIEFNMTSIAAILTIVGYSLNDTVVVFDRIARDAAQATSACRSIELLDLSMNSTLSRTLMTGDPRRSCRSSRSSLFGGEVIQGFAYAMLFGVVVGTYSSIFISAPILIYLGLRVGGAEAPVADGRVAQPAE